jgi:hypothetical protein
MVKCRAFLGFSDTGFREESLQHHLCVTTCRILLAVPKESAHLSRAYSPECVEGVFSEVGVPDGTGAYSRSRIFMHHHYM